jgi:hypothetical protein
VENSFHLPCRLVFLSFFPSLVWHLSNPISGKFLEYILMFLFLPLLRGGSLPSKPRAKIWKDRKFDSLAEAGA